MVRSDRAFLLVLDKLLSRVGEGSINVSVALTDSQEVTALKEANKALQARLDALQADFNRCEFRYRCECVINMRLTDLCREQGVTVPSSLFQRPDGMSG